MLSDFLEAKISDGWRHFVDLPIIVFFDELYEHTEKLRGAEITEFVADGVVEMQLDFEFRGHKFSIANQSEDYWFLVENPECPDEILLEIIEHFRELLER